MQTIVGVLLLVAISAAIQVVAPLPSAYLAPKATSYIYRSDNNGPASLITLGGPHYEQPHAFAPPLPLVKFQPAYQELNEAFPVPAHLPYVAAEPEHLEEHVEEDDDSEEYLEGDEITGLGHGFEKGEGNDYSEEHQSAHGDKGVKGYNSKHHHEKGESGHYGKEDDEGVYSEEEGEKGNHHDEADKHGSHHEASEEHEGGDHGHKKHHSKGEEVTGYHKVFHKDEFKKDHDFYDVADKSGNFNKHGYAKEHHGSEEGAHKEGGEHDSGSAHGDFGKKGFHAKGHLDDGEAGHEAEEGEESHYSNEGDYGKKGGQSEEKSSAYGDDEDDDDEY